jgi:tetratricopeptide (TPR) repeat protein
MSGFAKNGAALETTNELRLAEAVLHDHDQVHRLQIEWTRDVQPKTNSLAYRDRLWDLAWEQYEEAVAHRGTLSTPNLFMNRGRLLVSQGEFERAIQEFQTALAFAKSSTYFVVRQETSTHALRAIAVAYWNLRKFKDAEEWMSKAREVQHRSGVIWVPTLDKELEQLKVLAANTE